MLVNLLMVAGGSAVGGALRYLTAAMLAERSAEFPLATLLVNVVGGFAIGAIAALTPASPRVRLLAMTGLCGGFTTFSAFSLETITLAREGAGALALANIALNVVCSIAACWVGWRVVSGAA
jgi:CrcB protein